MICDIYETWKIKAQAQANAESAAYKVSTQDKLLADEIDKLEEKKLTDMRQILKEYTNIQMVFHAKALEMLTYAYNQLIDIDVESDLEEFRIRFTQPSLIGSNLALAGGASAGGATTSAPNSYENIFNQDQSAGGGGGSLPNSPRRSNKRANNNNNLSQGELNRRAKSNDNFKQQRNADSNNNGNSRYTSSSSNKKNSNSAPNLNNANNKQQSNQRLQEELHDLSTDDSDYDYNDDDDDNNNNRRWNSFNDILCTGFNFVLNEKCFFFNKK